MAGTTSTEAPRLGRPPKCGGCGECDRCVRAAYMRRWWADLPAARKREYLDKRGPQAKRPGRVPPPRAPEKKRARRIVSNALRDGRLVRQPCETCGTSEDVHAHHDDYAKPLDVRWLCRKHHMLLHRIYRAEPDAERPQQEALSTQTGASSGDGQESAAPNHH